MEYDILDFDIVLDEKTNTTTNDNSGNIEINIKPEEFISSITEEKLEKMQEFQNKTDEYQAEAISEAYNYVIF